MKTNCAKLSGGGGKVKQAHVREAFVNRQEKEVESWRVIISRYWEYFSGEIKVKKVGLSVAGSRCDWSQRERRASKHGQALFGTP